MRVWSRADEKRAETIRELRKKTETDYYDSPAETYWIPYCLSFLSRYPLYDLLGDYLRGMWIHWNKATNLFHAEEVSRILSFPAPRLNDLVRIDMKDYALCYQFPSSTTGFQNFAMWPLFACLSIPNIVGIIEAAVSPTRRLIFVSHYPAMLTMAAETIRYCVRVFEWSGLYVPIVHARHVTELVQEPGPYILGITAECRSLFTAPADALLVDLDRNFVLTSNPPEEFTTSQRKKMVNRLTDALKGDVTPSGVPQHLRSAYGGGKLVPAGQIIAIRNDVESIRDPEWWNQDAIMAVMDHSCTKIGRTTKVMSMFGKSQKKPLMTKISTRHLNEIIRERNQYSRDAIEAWQDFINLKGRMDTELAKVTKRNNFLVEELDSWKQQFLKFQAFAEQLTKETTDLKTKIEAHKKENRRLTGALDSQKEEIARMTVRSRGIEKQRDDALEALVLQQEIAEELERERKRNKKELSAMQHTNITLLRQRDEAQRVVLHLRALIEGQAQHMDHIVQNLTSSEENNNLDTLIIADGDEKAASSTTSRPLSTETLMNSPAARKRLSELNMSDIVDRQLRDKTDAIAFIIRNISEQCAAAVEGLHLAQRADIASNNTVAMTQVDASLLSKPKVMATNESSPPSPSNYSEFHSDSSTNDEPNQNGRRRRNVPSTTADSVPDLIHSPEQNGVSGGRSSASLSVTSVTTEDRESQSRSHWRMGSESDLNGNVMIRKDTVADLGLIDGGKKVEGSKLFVSPRVFGLESS